MPLAVPPPRPQVEVDLGLSAHSNARAYYDSRRKHQTKQARSRLLAVCQLRCGYYGE